MGDCQTEPLRPQFDRRLRLEFHGANVTSDAGLLAYRELDDALQLTDSAADELHDTRTGRNTRHGLPALLRQSLFSRLAGYEDLNDAQRLRVDPALRTVVGGRAKDHTAASTSEIGRFETDTLTTRANLNRLMDLSGQWIDRAHRHRKLTRIVLDMDSSVSETYGRRQAPPTTATSAAPATIPCSSSTSSATWSGSCSGAATTTAPSSGGGCCCR